MKLSERIEKACKQGLRFPFLHDPVSKQPSVTLLFAYVSFILVLISIVCLHFYAQIQSASLVSILFFVICMVFYRLRKLDSVAVNLKSGEVALKGDSKDG